jgi:hypothetical protein
MHTSYVSVSASERIRDLRYVTDDRIGQAYADVLRMHTLTYDVRASGPGAALVHMRRHTLTYDVCIR